MGIDRRVSAPSARREGAAPVRVVEERRELKRIRRGCYQSDESSVNPCLGKPTTRRDQYAAR